MHGCYRGGSYLMSCLQNRAEIVHRQYGGGSIHPGTIGMLSPEAISGTFTSSASLGVVDNPFFKSLVRRHSLSACSWPPVERRFIISPAHVIPRRFSYWQIRPKHLLCTHEFAQILPEQFYWHVAASILATAKPLRFPTFSSIAIFKH